MILHRTLDNLVLEPNAEGFILLRQKNDDILILQLGIRHVICCALNWSLLKYCRQSTLEILSTVDTWNVVEKQSILEMMSTVDTWNIVDSRHLKYCRQSTLEILSTADTWNIVGSRHLKYCGKSTLEILSEIFSTVDTWNLVDSRHLKCCRQPIIKILSTVSTFNFLIVSNFENC